MFISVHIWLWSFLIAIVAFLIAIVIIGWARPSKPREPSEIFQPYLSIRKFEKSGAGKRLVIENNGKGRANQCTIENLADSGYDFEITGPHHIHVGGSLKMLGNANPGKSVTAKNKFQFLIHYQDDGGEQYKIMVKDDGSGPKLQNMFL